MDKLLIEYKFINICLMNILIKSFKSLELVIVNKKLVNIN